VKKSVITDKIVQIHKVLTNTAFAKGAFCIPRWS